MNVGNVVVPKKRRSWLEKKDNRRTKTKIICDGNRNIQFLAQSMDLRNPFAEIKGVVGHVQKQADEVIQENHNGVNPVTADNQNVTNLTASIFKKMKIASPTIKKSSKKQDKHS